MYCNKCFEEIPDGSIKCPHCGADLTKGPGGKKKSGGSLFGGSKKNKRKGGGVRFDENGNRIDDGPRSNKNTGKSNAFGGGKKSGGGRAHGGTNGGNQIDPKILIILGASLVLIIVIIVGISLFMKKRGEDNRTAAVPTSAPTAVPTSAPTAAPTSAPTAVPTSAPTAAPTSAPTAAPTAVPTATPTKAAADKASVNSKSSFDEDTADSYFWPYSNTRLYTFEDLENLSIDQIGFVKAEIYAREGCIFKDKKYSDYFNKKNWFKGSIEEAKFNPDRFLNYYELENVRMIETYLKEKS